MPSRALPPGIGSAIELGMRFARWAAAQREEPSPASIMRAFGVSRATAFRYLEAYRGFVSIDEPLIMEARKPARRGASAGSKPQPSAQRSEPTWPPPAPDGGTPPACSIGSLVARNSPAETRRAKALIDLKETMRRSGLRKSAIYDRMAAGTFPKACKIGVSTRWVDAEVDAWVEQRLEERDA